MSNLFSLIFVIIVLPSYVVTYILSERLKELAEDAEREKALKDVTNAMAKEKGKAAEAIEKKAQSSEKARLVAERKLA